MIFILASVRFSFKYFMMALDRIIKTFSCFLTFQKHINDFPFTNDFIPEVIFSGQTRLLKFYLFIQLFPA